MATPVFWEGNIGSAPEHRSFPNGNNPPRQLLRLNVMFDNSIPDGQGGYKDRGGFWCSVEWWHQDAQRFAELFAKGMRVKVEGVSTMGVSLIGSDNCSRTGGAVKPGASSRSFRSCGLILAIVMPLPPEAC